MEHLRYFHHLTDVRFLDDILKNGLLSGTKTARLVDEGNIGRYVWFDYIGEYEGKLFYSSAGKITATGGRTLCFVLNPQTLIAANPDHVFMITSEFSRFEDYEYDVWRSDKDGETDMAKVVKHGVEAIADVFQDKYLPIREHILFIVSGPDNYDMVRHVLRSNGLESLPVVVFDPTIKADGEHLITMCENLDGEIPPALQELAVMIHVRLSGNKRDACVLLYQLLLMIAGGLEN
jgi:hypothetical protein